MEARLRPLDKQVQVDGWGILGVSHVRHGGETEWNNFDDDATVRVP